MRIVAPQVQGYKGLKGVLQGGGGVVLGSKGGGGLQPLEGDAVL